MLQNEVEKEQILYFAERVKNALPFEDEYAQSLVKKGLLLYRQGSVYNVKFNGQTVEGTVQDVTPVEVNLDMDYPDMSTCSCPSFDFCRHKLALFFYLYASVDRVGALLDEWKFGKAEPAKKLPFPLKTARDLLNERQAFDEGSIDSWHEFYEKEYEKFMESRPDYDPYFSASIYSKYFNGLITKAPKTNEMKRLFVIHAAIAAFQKLAEYQKDKSMSRYQMEAYILPYLDNLIDKLEDTAIDLSRVQLPFSMDPLLEESTEKFRPFLLDSEGEFASHRLAVYRILWGTVFYRPKWIAREQEHLKGESSFEKLAQASLAFLEKKDEVALGIMKELGPHFFPFLYQWLESLAASGNWKRMEPWMQFSLESLEEYLDQLGSFDSKRRSARTFLSIVYDYGNLHDEKAYASALQKLMPYSYIEYSDYLADKEDYKKWLELQMFLQYEIEVLEKQVLKKIEERDRSLLLPLYHQAAVREIGQKNRQSYKRAVRYLKKLRTHYKKLKKEDVWEHYIERTAAAHKRLRAFQEELKRGKLIHD